MSTQPWRGARSTCEGGARASPRHLRISQASPYLAGISVSRRHLRISQASPYLPGISTCRRTRGSPCTRSSCRARHPRPSWAARPRVGGSTATRPTCSRPCSLTPTPTPTIAPTLTMNALRTLVTQILILTLRCTCYAHAAHTLCKCTRRANAHAVQMHTPCTCKCTCNAHANAHAMHTLCRSCSRAPPRWPNASGASAAPPRTSRASGSPHSAAGCSDAGCRPPPSSRMRATRPSRRTRHARLKAHRLPPLCSRTCHRHRRTARRHPLQAPFRRRRRCHTFRTSRTHAARPSVLACLPWSHTPPWSVRRSSLRSRSTCYSA